MPARSTRSTRETMSSLEAARPDAASVDGQGCRNAAGRRRTTTSWTKSARGETSEKQASKARQTERMIERLDVVDEPRKEWELRMRSWSHRVRAPSSPSLRHAIVRRGAFTLGLVTSRSTGPIGSRSRCQRIRQDDVAARAARQDCDWTTARSRSVRASWSARWIRPAGLFLGNEPLAARVRRELCRR